MVMPRRVLLRAVFVIVSFASARALHCNEGFNATVFEVPFYQWTEQDCHAKSDCFSQEITLKMDDSPGSEVTVRYGGCISAAYARLVSCESLFGPESTLDPADLLNVVTKLDDGLERMTADFLRNSGERFKMLFSNGKNVEEFITGVFKLDENMGFNMKKARPLIKPMAKIFSTTLAPDFSKGYDSYIKSVDDAFGEFMSALESLDTKNPKMASNLYSFMSNFKSPSEIEEMKNSKYFRPLIENLPGLLESMVATKYGLDFDLMFEILGDIKFTDPSKSTVDVITTIKTKISKDLLNYLDPLFQSLPDLVDHMSRGEVMYINIWSLRLLKQYSVKNEATASLSNSVLKFIKDVAGPNPIPREIEDLATWLPGVFYKLFPADKAEIDRVYEILANGLDSLDLLNTERIKPSEETKMSEFLIGFIGKLVPDLPPWGRNIITSISKTFYSLMKPEFKDELDLFFSTLKEGFKSYPKIDSGQIITDLVTNFGESIPPALKPLLKNAQNILQSITSEGTFAALERLVNDYQRAFPESEFPGLAERFLHIVNKSLDVSKLDSRHCYADLDFTLPPEEFDKKLEMCAREVAKDVKLLMAELNTMGNDFEVDLFFAIFRALGYDTDEVVKTVSKMNPSFGVYVRLINALKPEDLKELLHDYSAWDMKAMADPNHATLDSFIYAINASVAKITSKLGDVIKELRIVHAPEICKFLSCTGDLCNTHAALEAATPLRRIGFKVNENGEVEQDDAGGGARNTEATVPLTIASLWLTVKLNF